MNPGITLRYHDYKYFPYEKDLALREVKRLVGPDAILAQRGGIAVQGGAGRTDLDRLVYFRSYDGEGHEGDTLQHRLESSCCVTGGHRKQTTRYSIHGLHDYRGKFNPQVVRGIFNVLGVQRGERVVDPFCGSGTTLVEGTYAGVQVTGTDVNPLAVFVSNAKVRALATPADGLRSALARVVVRHTSGDPLRLAASTEGRDTYLASWFEPHTLAEIERLRGWIQTESGVAADVLAVIASDILRDYSLQEPSDLRIRRRFSPMPERPLFDAFTAKAAYVLDNLEAAQAVTGTIDSASVAHLVDNRDLPSSGAPLAPAPPYTAALTSPPYATALPYIDTQRLSLVWLGLCDDDELKPLEAGLTGSREFVRGERNEWNARLDTDADALAEGALAFCRVLRDALSQDDGFRRQAVPSLLYRYLVSMRATFRTVLPIVAPGAPFALVVGHNRTTLGGTPFDIDTPNLLRVVAVEAGWAHRESVALQTYQRYGLHQKNAVKDETLLILERPQR